MKWKIGVIALVSTVASAAPPKWEYAGTSAEGLGHYFSRVEQFEDGWKVMANTKNKSGTWGTAVYMVINCVTWMYVGLDLDGTKLTETPQPMRHGSVADGIGTLVCAKK